MYDGLVHARREDFKLHALWYLSLCLAPKCLVSKLTPGQSLNKHTFVQSIELSISGSTRPHNATLSPRSMYRPRSMIWVGSSGVMMRS